MSIKNRGSLKEFVKEYQLEKIGGDIIPFQKKNLSQKGYRNEIYVRIQLWLVV